MMRGLRWSLLLVLALTGAACANLSGEPPIVATVLPEVLAGPDEPEATADAVDLTAYVPDVTRGAEIYFDNCAACHGDLGRGDGPVALANPAMTAGNFTNPASARSQTPLEWYTTITEGRIDNLMPPWGNTLSAEERWDVAMYTYTLHYTADMLETGRRIYMDCAECHGETGRGDGPEAAGLERTVGDLSDREEMSTLSDESIFDMVTQGSGGIMPSYAHLSEAERYAVAAYARTLSLDWPEMPPMPDDSPIGETTDALTDITGTALLLQIHAVGDALEIVQALRLRNTSDTLAFSHNTLLNGGERAALVLHLPEGAALTSATGGINLSADGSTIYVHDPIPPRTEQLYVLSYTLPYTAGSPLSIPVDVTVNGPVRVLLRPLEMFAHSNALDVMGEQTLGDQLYNAYGGQLVLPSGSMLAFTLTGAPDAPPAIQVTPEPTAVPAAPRLDGVVTGDVLAPLIGLAMAVLVIAVGLYAYRTRTPSPQARIMQIAREIGRIDAEHEAGRLNHDLWHRQRAALKAEQMKLRGLSEDTDE